MSSNYDALSGGVSAFGGLGRDFGRVGRLGALGRAQGSSGPVAIVAAMDAAWTSANAVPIYDLDAAWADQDDLQYEIQTAGGDWSGATVSHHTVTTSEIGGVQITFSGASLANANYEARFKFKHFGGVYSAYSNVVPFTVAASTTLGQPMGLLLSLTYAA